MGVTIELQNLGDAQLSREIVAGVEHALSDKQGEWRVSIAESHGSENWEMRELGNIPSINHPDAPLRVEADDRHPAYQIDRADRHRKSLIR